MTATREPGPPVCVSQHAPPGIAPSLLTFISTSFFLRLSHHQRVQPAPSPCSGSWDPKSQLGLPQDACAVASSPRLAFDRHPCTRPFTRTLLVLDYFAPPSSSHVRTTDAARATPFAAASASPVPHTLLFDVPENISIHIPYHQNPEAYNASLFRPTQGHEADVRHRVAAHRPRPAVALQRHPPLYTISEHRKPVLFPHSDLGPTNARQPSAPRSSVVADSAFTGGDHPCFCAHGPGREER